MLITFNLLIIVKIDNNEKALGSLTHASSGCKIMEITNSDKFDANLHDNYEISKTKIRKLCTN